MKTCSYLVIAAILCTINMLPNRAVAQKNVLIYEQEPGKYAPCEPSIAIDPSNSREMIAGAVMDYMFVSKNNGLSWNTYQLKSKYGVYGDPCIVADDNEQFYYFHLSDPEGEGWNSDKLLDRIVVQKRNKRNHWNKGKGIGHNPPKDQDKEWATWDPYQQRLVVTWTQFDEYGSKDPGCESNILLSTSKNGKKWKKPIQINSTPGNCEDNSQTAEGAVPAVDAYGNTLVAWNRDGKIYFQTISAQSGKPVGQEKEIVDNANWSFDVPGFSRMNGMPVTVADRSARPTRGNVYINWTDQRNGEDDTDVWIVKSADGGFTWSEPIRVNDDPAGKHQFMSWMAIDQETGYLYVVFYDRRNHEGNMTDVYLAISHDGGDTWENRKISEEPFEPSGKVFFGDYINIDVVKGNVRPIWTREKNQRLSIWTAIISD